MTLTNADAYSKVVFVFVNVGVVKRLFDSLVKSFAEA